MESARTQVVYAEYCYSSEDCSLGFTKLMYGALANASNGLAWCLDDHIGYVSEFETLTCFCPYAFSQDALVLAACKASYKVSGAFVQPQCI